MSAGRRAEVHDTVVTKPRFHVQLCDHTTSRMCSRRGRNRLSTYNNGFCSITQLLARSKISKSHCVILQEPFLHSVRTLSENLALSAARRLSATLQGVFGTSDKICAKCSTNFAHALRRLGFQNMICPAVAHKRTGNKKSWNCCRETP